MQLTLVEIDPCSSAAVPRRIPDDYQATGLVASTDFGSGGERVFEVRSIGTAPLTLTSVALSEESMAFTVQIEDAEGNELELPRVMIANRTPGAPPGAVIRVTYNAAFGRPNTALTLSLKTDDPNRSSVDFVLAAGRGRMEVCGTNGCVDDPVVQFGNVTSGSSDTRQITIRNVGDGDLDLRDLLLESTSSEFCAPEVLTMPEGVTDCPTRNLCKVLKAGEEYVINVTYSPVDGGEDTGVVRIVSGDALRGTVDVPINGTGAGPGLCLCLLSGTDCVPASVVDFGAVGVGDTERRRVRFVSCGTDPVNLMEVALETDPGNPFRTSPDFTISAAFTTGSLAVGEFAEGEVAYTPMAAGTHRGGLRYVQGSGTRSWISLVGRAATCDLEVLPAQLSFGTVASGSSVDRQVAMINNGAQDCVVSEITDPSNGFSLVNRPTLPLTVGPGQSETLTVRFAPAASQTPQAAMSSFTVTSNELPPGSVNTVNLSALGGGTPSCSLDVQPRGNSILSSRHGQLQFGATTIGTTKTLGIRLTNTGNTDCVLQGYNMTTTNPSQFMIRTSGATPLAIPPGSASSIDVTFAPTGPAPLPLGYLPLTNYVDFTVAGPGLTQTAWSIGLNAQPVIPTIEVTPAQIDFGLVTWENPQAPDMRSSCGSRNRTVRIYNTGSGVLDVSGIRIDQTSDLLFRIVSVNNNGTNVNAPYAMQIAPGSSASVDLRFFPTRIMPPVHQGLLIIENNVTTESTVPLRGEGTPNAMQTDVYSQLSDNKVDILWVIDDSCSMSEEQAALAANLGGFIAYANSQNVDYHVGVVTTDVDAANRQGKLVNRTSDPANRIVTRNTQPSAEQVFRTNTMLGTSGSGIEQGLQAARLALSPPTRDMENAGFLRADARLAIIIVSDEEDQSPGPADVYIDFFRDVKGFNNPQLVSLHAIAGDVPNGCATADAGRRYQYAAQALGGQFHSICSSNWAPLLNNIGLGVFALRQAWTLSRPADPPTITVRVNGMTVAQSATNGWTYDAASNTVTFHGSAVPPPGATIEIRYRATCIP